MRETDEDVLYKFQFEEFLYATLVNLWTTFLQSSENFLSERMRVRISISKILEWLSFWIWNERSNVEWLNLRQSLQ